MNSITVKQKIGHCLPAMAGLLVAATALFCFTGGAQATGMSQKPWAAPPAQAMGAGEASGQEKFLQGNTGPDGQYIVEARRGGSSGGSSASSGRGRGGESGSSGGSSSSSSSGRSSSRSSDDGSHREDSGLHHRSDSQELRSLQEDRLDRLGDDSAVRGGGSRR